VWRLHCPELNISLERKMSQIRKAGGDYEKMAFLLMAPVVRA
jgi:hypothetical protein